MIGINLKNKIFGRFYNFLFKLKIKKVGKNLICRGRIFIQPGINIIVGDNVVLGSGKLINPHKTTSELIIHDSVYMDHGFCIDVSGNISIKKDVRIAQDTIIYTHSHLYFHDINEDEEKIVCNDLTIEEGVFVGARSIILSNVTKIEKHSRVGAGAVVTKNVSAYSIVGGNPAKIIKKLDPEPN